MRRRVPIATGRGVSTARIRKGTTVQVIRRPPLARPQRADVRSNHPSRPCPRGRSAVVQGKTNRKVRACPVPRQRLALGRTACRRAYARPDHRHPLRRRRGTAAGAKSGRGTLTVRCSGRPNRVRQTALPENVTVGMGVARYSNRSRGRSCPRQRCLGRAMRSRRHASTCRRQRAGTTFAG